MFMAKGVIDWALPEREFYSQEDRILLMNGPRNSVFSLPNCTLRVIIQSAPLKNICDIIMSKPQERLISTLEG